MLKDFLRSSSTKHAWEKVGVGPHHGIHTPLFSLRTENSQGIGEFFDLFVLMDLAAKVGFHVLQILPIQDTGFSSSPYNAVSSTALNPIYVHIPSLEKAEKTPGYVESQRRLCHWNLAPKVCYYEVRKEKFAFFRQYFQMMYQENTCKEEIEAFKKNHPWSVSYAIFLSLKDKYQQVSWQNWPEKERNPTCFSLLEKTFQVEMDFYIFLQVLSTKQMIAVKNYADKKKIFLKGDIPILVSPDSADVWAERDNFSLSYTTGCPPDLFNYEGQNWGFPIFSWNHIVKTDYVWWKRRLQIAEQFFHLYRIDHLVGFFRTWAIPIGKSPKAGHFTHPNRMLWPFHAKERIKALIGASSMLPLGEDLGIMPKEASRMLQELGVAGTRLTRWVKYWEEDGSFVPSSSFDPISVTTLSSHDTSTFGSWWQENPLEASLYAKSRGVFYEKTLSSSLRKDLLKDAHKSSSIFHINLLMEYAAMFPEFSFPPKTMERINIPGTESEDNWSLRYKFTLEILSKHKGFCSLLELLAR